MALLVLGFAQLAGPSLRAQDSAPVVSLITVNGAIGPATASYIKDELTRAAEQERELVVLRMDTPGGLSASMRDIISAMLASPVPVAAYVAPRGARAASAGTYILYASHIAAMAPGTTLGAATPVQMGGGNGSPLPGGGDGEKGKEPSKDKEDKATKSAPPDAKTAKAVNDAVAYIRALAKMRGRNAEWAEKAVLEAATLTVDEAVAKNVADLRAENLKDLLAKIDGRTLRIGEETVQLATANARIEDRAPDWRDELLAAITNPNIAFILMMLGVYGLIFELSNPGALVPGVLGAICLMMGFYALNVLPVNYAGLALMALGIAFMTAEAFAPSFGILGLGGLAAFALGATILFDTGSPEFGLSYWTIFGVTAASGLVLVLLIGYLVGAQRKSVRTGQSALIGTSARVESWHDGRGRVLFHGERWNARGPAHLEPGQMVAIVAVEGLSVTVAPLGADSHPTPAGGTS